MKSSVTTMFCMVEQAIVLKSSLEQPKIARASFSCSWDIPPCQESMHRSHAHVTRSRKRERRTTLGMTNLEVLSLHQRSYSLNSKHYPFLPTKDAFRRSISPTLVMNSGLAFTNLKTAPIFFFFLKSNNNTVHSKLVKNSNKIQMVRFKFRKACNVI